MRRSLVVRAAAATVALVLVESALAVLAAAGITASVYAAVPVGLAVGAASQLPPIVR